MDLEGVVINEEPISTEPLEENVANASTEKGVSDGNGNSSGQCFGETNRLKRERGDDINDIDGNNTIETPQYATPYRRTRKCSRCGDEGHDKRNCEGQQINWCNSSGIDGNRNNHEIVEGIGPSTTEAFDDDNEDMALIAMLNRRKNPRRTPFGVGIYRENDTNASALPSEDDPLSNHPTQSSLE